MKVLYLECRMGASGDMLMGALSELVDQKKFIEIMNHAGIEGVEFSATSQTKCGIMGTHMEVLIHGHEEMEHVHHEHTEHEHHHHHHASMNEIQHTIMSLNVSDEVKRNALVIYQSIAEAESHVHGIPVTEIHLHEVGMKDAIADIVGNCVLMEMIHPDMVYASNVAVGNGTVHCAHGILPVPAPATAYLLQGIPFYPGKIEGELCTPTGAALLKYFVSSFQDMPPMVCEQIGYGLGTKEFEQANVLRTFLGTCEDHGEVVELLCNIDDQSQEEIGHAVDVLYAHGALDVYMIPSHMKKNRPGIVFVCTCKQQDEQETTKLMFQHLTTLGIRRNVCQRYTLQRSIEEVHTSLGMVHIKKSSGYGIQREKLEYNDLASIAEKNHMSIAEVRNQINKERNHE